MCLFATERKPKKANKDIICYKLVTEDYKSPCYDFQYEIGKSYETELDKVTDLYHKSAWNRDDFFNAKYKGFHTYIFKDEAVENSKTSKWVKCLEPKGVKHTVKAPKVLKCIIPKGSLYYMGTTSYFGTENYSYCSNKLTVIEEISNVSID